MFKKSNYKSSHKLKAYALSSKLLTFEPQQLILYHDILLCHPLTWKILHHIYQMFIPVNSENLDSYNNIKTNLHKYFLLWFNVNKIQKD